MEKEKLENIKEPCVICGLEGERKPDEERSLCDKCVRMLRESKLGGHCRRYRSFRGRR